MPRMRILSLVEQEAFEVPPNFNSEQRKRFFDFPKTLLGFSAVLRKPSNQISFFAWLRLFLKQQTASFYLLNFIAAILSMCPTSWIIA